jgi:hypothetical protein
MLFRELTPWRDLTRTGIPALKVALRPLVLGEVTIPVGQTINPEVFPLQIRRERLRQFYEMRRLEPVEPLPNTRQYLREQKAREATAALAVEPLVEPVVPVASRIVADLPQVDVPVEETVRGFRQKPPGRK